MSVLLVFTNLKEFSLLFSDEITILMLNTII